MTDASRTPEALVREVIANWPTVRVPISPESIQDFIRHFDPYLTADFDTSVLALTLDSREEFTMSQTVYTTTAAKILVLVGNDVWLAILAKDAEENWKLQAFTFRCPRCFGQGYYYSGSELCAECGGSGWGAHGDIEFRPGKLKAKQF
jgi:hypothetical protein